MSLALYRTYRPSVLDEVIGQEHVTEPLRRALDQGRVHHAYLFSGPRGCGKTSTARILARSLICEQGPTSRPCGQCQFCVALAPNGSGLVDVIELDAASHGGVDDTRDLRERAAFVPASARFKVYIIDEAHMVSKDGFNALLKLIEEPPEHLKFIFATTEVDKVIPTIRSRTFNYAFRLVPVNQLQDNLGGICQAEGVPYEPGALALVARASGGSVRDAQSIMGQLIAGASDAGLVQSDVAIQLGVTDDALLDSTVAAIATADGAAVFDAVSRVVESGHDVRRFATDLLHQFRDLILLTHAGQAASAEVLDTSDDRRDALMKQAGAFSAAQLSYVVECINDGLTHLKGSTSPRLQLEIMLSRLLLPAADATPESLLARVDVLERRIAAVSSLAHSPPRADHAPNRSTPPTPSSQRDEPRPSVGSDADPDSGPPAEPVAQRSGNRPAVPDRRPDGGPAQPSDSAPGLEPAAPASRPETDRGAPTRGGPSSPPRRPAPGARPSLPSLRRGEGGRPPGRRAEPPARPDSSRSSPQDESVSSPSERGGAQSVAEPREPGRASPTEPGPADTGGPDLAAVRRMWPRVIEAVGQQSRVARAAWHEAEPVALSDNELVVRVPQQGQAASIRASKRDLALRTLLIERFSLDLTVRVTTDEAPPPDVPQHDDPAAGTGGDLTGVDLAMQELGARKIEEIETDHV